MKQTLVLASVLMLCGCATTIDSRFATAQSNRGVTGPCAIVIALGDNTGGDNGLDWDKGDKYRNIGGACADAVARACAESGLFRSVEREDTPPTESPARKKQNAVVIRGSVEEFKLGGKPTGVTLINPVALASLLGAPTANATFEGVSRIALKAVDTVTGQSIFVTEVNSRFGPLEGATSAWGTSELRKKYAGHLLAAVQRDVLNYLNNLRGQRIPLFSQNPSDTPQASGAPTSAQPASVAAGVASVSRKDGPGRRYALLIGISEYSDPGFGRLQFADADAKDMRNALVKLGFVTEDCAKILLNQEAKQESIKDALYGFLQKAGKEDVIMLYWSGHGFADPENPEKCYFACYDTMVKKPWTGYEMKSVREALEEHTARNVVMLADTCHSAGVFAIRGTKGVDIEGTSPLDTYVNKMRRVGKGMAFLVAGDTDRKALEDTAFKNGVFTHFILEALRGAADGFKGSGDKDGLVTLGELVEYVRDKLPAATLEKLGHAQHPAFFFPSADASLRELPLCKLEQSE